MAWKVAREIVDSDARFGNFDTIALAHGKDSSGHALAQINAVRSLNGIANSGQLLTEPLEAKNGHVQIPEGPGWGVEINSAWLEKTVRNISER
jgi:hypothetical protein